MNNLLSEYTVLYSVIIVIITLIALFLIMFKPHYQFTCYSKTDNEDDIRYNLFNNTYYYCENDHYGCINRKPLTISQLKEYDLIASKPLVNKEIENKLKNKIKMEKSKPSLLLKILKQCFLIIIIILTYKIGMVIIKTVPSLIKNQLTTINK